MSDVDTRVREVLRDLADEAPIDPVLLLPVRRRIRHRRVLNAAGAAVFAVALVGGAVFGIAAAVHLRENGTIHPASSSTPGGTSNANPEAWPGLFPSTTREVAEQLQACSDAGDESCTGYLDLKQVLRGYGKTIWGAQPYYFDDSLVSLDADGSGPSTITIGQCIPGGSGFLPGCTVADVTLERLLRHDRSGVWFVTSVHQYINGSPEAIAEARAKAFVAKFMQLRLQAAPQALDFLSARGKDSYDHHEGGLQLFGEGVAGNGYLFQHFEVQSISSIDASSYEVQVYMLVGKDPGDQNAQDWVETLTVGPGPDYKDAAQPLVVTSAVLTSAQPRPAP